LFLDGIVQTDQKDEKPPHLNPLPRGERKIKEGVFAMTILFFLTEQTE
jgi:hypothetical protein